MKRYLPFIIVALVGIATLAAGTALYRASRPTKLAALKDDTKGENGAGHFRGEPNAPVTIEEYGDFQCPPCGMMAPALKQFEKDFEPHLRVVFHNFPLINHTHAKEAAQAAEAAGLQGRFWEMHDMLYREQAVWSKATDARPLFMSYAGMIGLNLDRFKIDIDSQTVKERVEADQKHGTSLGVKNTPTLFINNQAVEPKNLNPADLRAAIQAAVKEKTAKK